MKEKERERERAESGKREKKKGKKDKVKQKKKRKKGLIREIVYNYANPLMISAFYFCIECIKNM